MVSRGWNGGISQSSTRSLRTLGPLSKAMSLSMIRLSSWLVLLTAVLRVDAQGYSYTLTRTHGVVSAPVLEKTHRNLSWTWTINAFSSHRIILKFPKVPLNDDCGCMCFQIRVLNIERPVNKKLCRKDLPLTLNAHGSRFKILFTGARLSSLRKGPLFSYDIKQAKSLRSSFSSHEIGYLDKPPNRIRLEIPVSEVKHRFRRDSDLKPTNGSPGNKEAGTEPATGDAHNNSVSDPGKKNQPNRLPVILPAVLTVVIFIVCVALIAYNSYNADDFPYDGSALDLQNSSEGASCWPKRRNTKRHGRSEVYDVMLKEYKAEKRRKDPLRKSSTIQIEGVGGNDPQSIAKKHLLLKRMRGDSASGAVSTLIKLSSTAFIASSMVTDDSEESKEVHETIPEEDSTPLLDNEEQSSPKQQVLSNGTAAEEESARNEDGKPEIPKIELALSNSIPLKQDEDEQPEQKSPDGVSLSPDFTTENKEKRNSGPVWFKYKRLEKQPYVTDDSDEELDYDCAQHIHRILSASRENIEEARRILPDDVKDIILPKDLETALAEFELWPDSSV